MLILGIETSCDDTGVAIVKTPDKRGNNFKILSNIVSSQIKVHAKFGGVVPNLAAREHLKNIEPCLREAFKESGVKPEQIDSIAVTIGPGLIPCLLIGVNFAKTLAYVWKKPIIGVNHVEAHIIAALSSENSKLKTQNSKLFPAVALVVSGGHTQLVLIRKLGDYKILGETRDDAAGECFDKVAKLLKLGYPGGPAVAACAARYTLNPKCYTLNLPRPMIKHRNYDFSFSGLKTAVLYLVRKNVGVTISHICAETQQAIIDVLIDKTIRAAKEYKVKTVILSGGVAANKELRKQMANAVKNLKSKPYTLIPNPYLCTDNAVMIAMAGYFKKPTSWRKIRADANLRIS